jgi:hypothetical protein
MSEGLLVDICSQGWSDSPLQAVAEQRGIRPIGTMWLIVAGLATMIKTC